MGVTNRRPAIVRFIGEPNGGKAQTKGKFTVGKTYEAFFLEYWESERNALHVRGDDGEITYFNQYEFFEKVSDEDNLLNEHEAIVRCITHAFDDELLELKYGREYKAIGINSDGNYLVMDESAVCYFYEPNCFEIVEDKHDVLKQEVYWWFNK